MRRLLALIVLGLPAGGPAFAQLRDSAGPALETPEPASPTPVLRIPGAAKPAAGPFEAPAGPPAYAPALPAGTPLSQLEEDAATPVTTVAIALERAYWTEPRLLAERARLRSVDYRLPQARGLYGPQLQASASHSYQRDYFENSLGGFARRAGWSTTATAVLTQPLFTFGRLRANEDGARAEIGFERAVLRATEQQTLLNTISVYAAVLRDRAGVSIARDNSRLLDRQYGDTSERQRLREATSTDSQQVGARLQLAQAQLLSAERAAGSSDATFLRIIGSPAGELQPPAPLKIPVATLEEAYVYASAHNPVLASAYARERISRAAFEGARADRLPRVDAQARATYGSISPYNDDLKQVELIGGVTLSQTLDTGGKAARQAEASEAHDADWRLIDAALRENRAELADAWNEWQAQTNSLSSLHQGVILAQQALEGALIQERAGARTTLDVLELARDLLQIRTTYNETAASSYVAQARVLAAMGALDLDALVPDARTYDYESHLEKVRHQADFPLLTPAIRTLESITTGSRADKPVRDPTAPLAVDSVSASNDEAPPPSPTKR